MYDISETTFNAYGDTVAAYDMLGKVRGFLAFYTDLGVAVDVKVIITPTAQNRSAALGEEKSVPPCVPTQAIPAQIFADDNGGTDELEHASSTDGAGDSAEDFPCAASSAQGKSPQKQGLEATVERLRKELDLGQRADLRGFRSPVVRSLVAQVLEEERRRLLMRNPEAEPFTQTYWNGVKPTWAPRGEMMIKVFDLPWREIMGALWSGNL